MLIKIPDGPDLDVQKYHIDEMFKFYSIPYEYIDEEPLDAKRSDILTGDKQSFGKTSGRRSKRPNDS